MSRFLRDGKVHYYTVHLAFIPRVWVIYVSISRGRYSATLGIADSVSVLANPNLFRTHPVISFCYSFSTVCVYYESVILVQRYSVLFQRCNILQNVLLRTRKVPVVCAVIFRNANTIALPSRYTKIFTISSFHLFYTDGRYDTRSQSDLVKASIIETIANSGHVHQVPRMAE